MKRAHTFVAALVVTLALSGLASAHDVMGTVFYVDVGRSRVRLDVEIPIDELRSAYGFPSKPGIAELPASADAITAYLLAHLQVQSPEGAAFQLDARPFGVILHDGRNWQRIEVDATPPPGATPRDFVLHTDVIDHRVISHRVYVFLRHDLETGQIGEPVLLETLHYQSQEVRVQRAPGSLRVGLWAVFRLGMAHIAEGSDHLLFLFSLLLPAGLTLASRRRWGARRGAREASLDVVRIVTAFTLGHSLTLLVGALDLARLPSALVESLIALSVLVSAVHTLVPLFPRREAWVALGFGLVHGLGFASALEGLGVDGTTLALTVLGFNLGVEAMQMLLVTVTLPWVFLLQGTRIGAPFRQAGGVLTSVVALAWLGERALGVETLLPSWVDAAFAHGLWWLAGLAALALLANRRRPALKPASAR
ncbi:MAG: HupE/UreJ family protein [Polyangiales bacterium]